MVDSYSSSYQSDTTASCFRLSFATKNTSAPVYPRARTTGAHSSHNSTIVRSTAPHGKRTRFLLRAIRAILFGYGKFPISRSQPWNGPHRNTKKLISTAK